MRFWVGVTDYDWFQFLASLPDVDEVNFWQPSAARQAVILQPGDQFVFKLHAAQGGFIVGGGTFVRYTKMSPRWAWDAFGLKNGALSIDLMRARIASYRGRPVDVEADEIGAFVLVEPFFLPSDLWIAAPPDWAPNIVQGKTFDSGVGSGAALWQQLQLAQAAVVTPVVTEQPAAYGTPVLVTPRLGQGAFRVLVTDAYGRRCAVTGERTMPVLEAAHVRPYNLDGPHAIDNGLLLRSDLHTLFDRGYVTVTPDLTFRVSQRIKLEFENGRDYYALDGRSINAPVAPYTSPRRDYLEWHADTVFRG
jgi:putative restriction endonuclease